MAPRTQRFSVHEWNGDRALIAQAAQLYATVFAEAPYEDDPAESRTSFLGRVETYRRTKPDFRLMLATGEEGVIGLGLGTGISAGDWWRDRITPQLAPAAARTWFGEAAFSVVELATAAQHRRSGIAAALLDALVSDLPYPTATLTAYAAATQARRFYERQGWTEVATGLHIGESPELCLYGLRVDTPDRE
jgi:ribosomal protein S18 acetylase RimI-like enzyme